MTTLSTHVLDLANGKPAKGIAVSLYKLQDDNERLWIGDTITNEGGRIDQPFLVTKRSPQASMSFYLISNLTL